MQRVFPRAFVDYINYISLENWPGSFAGMEFSFGGLVVEMWVVGGEGYEDLSSALCEICCSKCVVFCLM